MLIFLNNFAAYCSHGWHVVPSGRMTSYIGSPSISISMAAHPARGNLSFALSLENSKSHQWKTQAEDRHL